MVSTPFHLRCCHSSCYHLLPLSFSLPLRPVTCLMVPCDSQGNPQNPPKKASLYLSVSTGAIYLQGLLQLYWVPSHTRHRMSFQPILSGSSVFFISTSWADELLYNELELRNR